MRITIHCLPLVTALSLGVTVVQARWQPPFSGINARDLDSPVQERASSDARDMVDELLSIRDLNKYPLEIYERQVSTIPTWILARELQGRLDEVMDLQRRTDEKKKAGERKETMSSTDAVYGEPTKNNAEPAPAPAAGPEMDSDSSTSSTKAVYRYNGEKRRRRPKDEDHLSDE